MRAVIQRVSSAEVRVGDEICGQIQRGLLVFLGVCHEDTNKDVNYLATKTAGLRIFAGPDGRMTLSARDIDASVLVVSQFTLYGDVRRGLRPSFATAAPPELAESLYEDYVRILEMEGLQVAKGVFRATMRISLVNDGPVTILLDSSKIL